MMTIREWIDDRADSEELELVVMDGFDDCIIGIVEEAWQDPKVAYDRGKVIDSLMEDMEWEEAWEFHNFNQTSQPGVVFLDRPNPFDGVMIHAAPVPWWHGAARTGLVLGTALMTIAVMAWIAAFAATWAGFTLFAPEL